MDKIWLLWEIPLALLSFVFNKIVKLVIGILFTVYLALNKSKAKQWRVLSEKMINAPLILPVMMTKGPRWNTHAIIGTLGPFKVENKIAIDIATASQSARDWIAAVYSFPDYKTVAGLASNKINSDSKWQEIKLPAGKYSLGVRYYNRSAKIDYPAIKVDDRPFVEAFNVPNDINRYYDDLISKKNWFYSSLHYYIYTILRLRDYLPESFVRNEYLPMGAPNTYFAYNYLEANQTLTIETETRIVEQCDLYFTLYDRSSLPLAWSIITEPNYIVPAWATNGYYLLRIRPKAELTSATVKVESKISVLDDSKQQLQLVSATSV